MCNLLLMLTLSLSYVALVSQRYLIRYVRALLCHRIINIPFVMVGLDGVLLLCFLLLLLLPLCTGCTVIDLQDPVVNTTLTTSSFWWTMERTSDVAIVGGAAAVDAVTAEAHVDEARLVRLRPPWRGGWSV